MLFFSPLFFSNCTQTQQGKYTVYIKHADQYIVPLRPGFSLQSYRLSEIGFQNEGSNLWQPMTRIHGTFSFPLCCCVLITLINRRNKSPVPAHQLKVRVKRDQHYYPNCINNASLWISPGHFWQKAENGLATQWDQTVPCRRLWWPSKHLRGTHEAC